VDERDVVLGDEGEGASAPAGAGGATGAVDVVGGEFGDVLGVGGWVGGWMRGGWGGRGWGRMVRVVMMVERRAVKKVGMRVVEDDEIFR
jgi:hypothetical protein